MTVFITGRRTGMSEEKIKVLRAGLVVSLMGLAACGTGYREGAAADAEAGSEALKADLSSSDSPLRSAP